MDRTDVQWAILDALFTSTGVIRETRWLVFTYDSKCRESCEDCALTENRNASEAHERDLPYRPAKLGSG